MDPPLETVLGDAGVDPSLVTALVADGWTTSSYRDIVTSSAEFTDSLYEELSAGNPLSLLQKAQLRSAWRQLQSQDGERPAGGQASSSTQSAAAPEGSWSESFPPKLNSSTVAQL